MKYKTWKVNFPVLETSDARIFVCGLIIYCTADWRDNLSIV